MLQLGLDAGAIETLRDSSSWFVSNSVPWLRVCIFVVIVERAEPEMIILFDWMSLRVDHTNLLVDHIDRDTHT